MVRDCTFMQHWIILDFRCKKLISLTRYYLCALMYLLKVQGRNLKAHREKLLNLKCQVKGYF